jgi:hypothetical protein
MMKMLSTLFMLILFSVTGVMAQYTAELRSYAWPDNTHDVHITPLPERVTLAFGGAEAPDVRFTGADRITTRSWEGYDGRGIFYGRDEGEQLYYSATVYEIEGPWYNHIATAYVDAPGVFAWPLIDGSEEATKWVWSIEEDDPDFIPAWDEELRALIEILENAVQQLQTDASTAEAQRDALQAQVSTLQAERDQAVEAVEPLQEQVSSLSQQLTNVQSELEQSKERLRALILSLPPGLRPPQF